MKQRPARELQIPFDRVTYREGQLLASRDLAGDFDAGRRLRRMHTRFLHDTWGIALGLGVDGYAGYDSVHIAPGYAIDASAREILSARDLSLPIPKTATTTDFLLVAGYQAEDAYRDLPDIAHLCAAAEVDPRDERPVFYWRTPNDLDLQVDVPLARVRVQNAALIAPPDLSVRRYARRLTRPHMATGTVQTTGRDLIAGLQVDTSDAGFADVPEYFVRLDAVAGGIQELIAEFVANSAFIASASAKGLQYFAPDLARILGDFGLQLQFVVTWLGVEPVSGCEPPSNPFLVFSLAGVLAHPAHFFTVTTKEAPL